MDEATEPITPSSEGEMNVVYANNVQFEGTIWDLKILFGEFFGRTKSVDWHTSITIPWAQAKLMAYYLQVNLAIHEANHGHVRVPSQVQPLEFPSLPESAQDKKEEVALHAKLNALHAELIASM